MSSIDSNPSKPAFLSKLKLSIENQPNSQDAEKSRYQMISNFIQEQQVKKLPSFNDQDPEELFSPLMKKKPNNLSHFSVQSQVTGSPSRSNYSNFDDNSYKKNRSLFQEFSLQNFIRKRNSEILKNLSRGSLLCPMNSEQKDPNPTLEEETIDLAAKPGQIQVLSFEDHYALKRVSANLQTANNVSRGITPLIMLHKKNLMKKVMEGTCQMEVQSSDSENNTDDDMSRNEEDELVMMEEYEEKTLVQVNLIQSSNLNFQDIVNENKKKGWKNMQETVNAANMMDNSEELDINAMIRKRILGKNIDVFEKEEQIYRKCMLKHLKMLPFYLFDYENSGSPLIRIVNERCLLKKLGEEQKKTSKFCDENDDFLFGNTDESENGLQTCRVTLGSIESSDKKTFYNTFLRNRQGDENEDSLFFSSFQGKFLHTHQIEANIMKASRQRFKDHIQIEMKKCSEEFIEDLMQDLDKSDSFNQHIKNNLLETLSNPKLLIKDIGSKTGAFAKLKSNNPILLDKNLMVMLTGHLGFFVDETPKEVGTCEECERVVVNEEFNEIDEGQELKLNEKEEMKNEETYLKLVFVKRNDELQLYEEYKKVILVYRRNQKSMLNNCIKLGKHRVDKNGNDSLNFLEKIRVKYDCYLVFHEQENIWFLVTSNEEQITTSLTSIQAENQTAYLNYPLFNKLQEKWSFKSNSDFYDSYKNEDKIVCGVNTVDKFVKNESWANLNTNLVDEGLGNSDYFSKPSCWVCLARFNLLQNKFIGENIEVGDGSIVKFGGNQILVRKIRIKQLPNK